MIYLLGWNPMQWDEVRSWARNRGFVISCPNNYTHPLDGVAELIAEYNFYEARELRLLWRGRNIGEPLDG